MANCDQTPTQTAKACSGKCKGVACGSPKVWVLAVCEGAGALFQKQPSEKLVPINGLDDSNGLGTALIDALRNRLIRASLYNEFNQLVLVGGAGDLSWAHATLPYEIMNKIVAEINYPLIPAWFRSKDEMGKLASALGNALH